MNERSSLDVVVRFHDVRRLYELDRCLFSLICQRFRPLRIILATQRFDAKQWDETRKSIARILHLDPSIELIWVNYELDRPKDARSYLINEAMGHVHSRFLAFLDYDDVIYPESYAILVDRLLSSQAAIAFGRIAVKRADICAEALLVTEKSIPFVGEGLLDMFRDNFCPIHSYVIDTEATRGAQLRFDSQLCFLEDYDFLLRFCAQYPSDFTRLDTVVGDYYYKSDGSNTMWLDNSVTEERRAEWMRCLDIVNMKKKTILISPSVQRMLGVAFPNPHLTIEDILKGTDGCGHLMNHLK